MVIGLIIIAVGVIAFLVKQGVLDGSVWDYAWPAILVIIGLSFILGHFRRNRRWWWWGGPPWMWHDRGNDKMTMVPPGTTRINRRKSNPDASCLVPSQTGMALY